MTREGGSSMIELLIAMSVMMAVTGGVFSVMNPSTGAFAVQPEAADMQQRLRVAADTLTKDLVMAGAGAYSDTQTGTLDYFFASVLPYRQGAIGADPIGTYRTDTISLRYVPSTTAQTTTSTVLTSTSNILNVNLASGCPVGQALCGFTAGMTVLIYDINGNFDTFTLTGVNASNATMSVNKPAGAVATTYAAGSKVVQAIDRTYYLKTDNINSLYQLVSYGGGTNAEVPVVDHVVGMKFEYYGDPQPPALRKPVSDPTGPWTTYGPRPPALDVQTTTTYPAGENCVFTVDPASGLQVPRLGVLGADPDRIAPILLAEAELTDGPWCPDADNANRFDADLLRIREIAVTLRVETSADALRGPASALFAHGGTAKNATKLLPDQEIRFQVAPRNLNLGR